jgi:hypothetical protein
MQIRSAFTVTLLATLGACVADDDTITDDTATLPEAELEQQGDPNSPEEIVHLTTPYLFGSTVFAGGPGNKTTYLVEDASTHTCFLRGIGGALKGQSSNWEDPRVHSLVSVEVDSATNNWKVVTKAGYGNGVWAYVSCVRNTTNVKFLYKTAGGAGNDYPMTDKRRCFLTGIKAYGSAMTGPRPNDEMPAVKVWPYGGTWRINTWFSQNTNLGAIDGHASAVCFDISGLGATGAHGVVNGDLPVFERSDYNDWYCGAEAIHGWFTGGQSTGAWSYKTNGSWRAKATSGHGLQTTCYY